MVLVNGKEIPVYKLDTESTFISRIAVYFDTLPKYIQGLPKNVISVQEIQIKNLLSIIKKDADKSTDFISFTEKNILTGLDLKKDVLDIWLSYNTQMKTLSEFSSLVLEQFAKPLVKAGYFSTTEDFIHYWKTGRESTLKDLEIKISQEKSINKKYTELYKIFENIEDGYGYTDFKTERVMLHMVLNLKNITILEIFNNLILNKSAPFAICKNYYKILKDYIPPEEWVSKGDDNIILKMHEKIIIDPDIYKDYTNIKIEPITDEKIGVVIKLITDRGYLSRDQFIDRFLSIFSGREKITYTNVTETEVVGIFYFPQERINTYVFSDLIMNNILFSSLINIDERNKATKQRTDDSQPWLYLHFNHSYTGHITAIITYKIVNRSDPIMRDEDEEIFPHGQPYIRVRVKGKDQKSVEFFQEILSKLLVIYNEKYEEIADIYAQFIPNFGVIEEVEVPPLKQAPGIFISNFSRYCSEARHPTIVSGEETGVIFPRNTPKSGPVYPSDGKKQNNYACLNPTFPYFGLQLNTKLSNMEEYPYIPCCFKNNQSERPGSVYRNYYFGEDLEIKDTKQHEFIITDKILGQDKYGTLPEDLRHFFEILDTDTTYRYIRVGIQRNQSSFLSAVMVGLHEQTGILEDEKRESRILQIRAELAMENISVMARQSCYDFTSVQISENIKNTEEYLDPKLYTQLLEGYFDCNIFLFNREKMFLPRFTQSLYRQRRTTSSIFIYENWGSESDNAKYPQCELIIRWNTKKKDDTQFFFPVEDKISRDVNKVYKLICETYALDKKINETIFPLPDTIQFVSQKIDSYGKTRCIHIIYKNENISILTSPISPLPIEEKDDEIYKVEKSLALDFLNKLGVIPVSQVLENYSLVQINSTLGNVDISIPIFETEGIPDLQIISGIMYPKGKLSSLSTFNQNKKMVRYMTEYLFWLFSKYIRTDDITDESLARFARKSFIIDPEHQYETVPKIFENNNSIMKNGKIIVQSEEMIKRLMYVLKLFSIRDINTLRAYYTRNTILHYYVDITDFDYHPNQVILQGEDSIEKWIQENKFSESLYRNIVVGQYIPYFFKNNLIVKSKVFLAQNANNLQIALAIAVNWQKSGYNSGASTNATNKKYTFTLYSYINPENITSMRVAGEFSLDKEIRIIGYKLTGSPFYTALLEFE